MEKMRLPEVTGLEGRVESRYIFERHKDWSTSFFLEATVYFSKDFIYSAQWLNG